MAIDISAQYPLCPMWYAFFIGFHKSRAIRLLGNGLAVQLEKRFFAPRSLFEGPECDIAFSELEVLGGEHLGEFELRTESSSSANVEILPMVGARFRLERSLARRANVARESLPVRRDIDLEKRVAELEHALLSINKLLGDAYQFSLKFSNYVQPELFPSVPTPHPPSPLPPTKKRTKKNY